MEIFHVATRERFVSEIDSLFIPLRHFSRSGFEFDFALVFRYGDVGKVCAFALRDSGARVLVTECDPFCVPQSCFEGVQMVAIETVMSETSLFLSTGNLNISTLVHTNVLRNTAFVGNTGHFDNEIDFAGSEGLDGMRVDNTKPQKIVSSLRWPRG